MHSRNWNGEQFSVDMACGEVRDWRGSMEKVRQKHEGLFILRSLIFTLQMIGDLLRILRRGVIL